MNDSALVWLAGGLDLTPAIIPSYVASHVASHVPYAMLCHAVGRSAVRRGAVQWEKRPEAQRHLARLTSTVTLQTHLIATISTPSQGVIFFFSLSSFLVNSTRTQGGKKGARSSGQGWNSG